jgi:hypothetical protein
MTNQQAQNAATDPGFFEDRFLIAIKAWDWPLSVGLSSELTAPEHRFQGGFHYVRAFDIEGEISAPREHRGRPVSVRILPFGEDLRFGPDAYPEVGRLVFRHPEEGRRGLGLTILLPEDAITITATCLASAWKYLHVWSGPRDEEQASIKTYAFSADIHPNLRDWANGD